MLSAERLMLLGGVAAFVLTLYWVRKRRLREKYAVVWIGVALLLLLCGLFPRAIMTFAETARLSYPAAVLFIALAAIYTFSFSVSVSLSRQYRRNVRLAQEITLLEHRVRALEQSLPARGEPAAANAAPPLAGALDTDTGQMTRP
jgi:hypothetical protein